MSTSIGSTVAFNTSRMSNEPHVYRSKSAHIGDSQFTLETTIEMQCRSVALL